jgi:stringent starvation protein B
LPLPEKQQWSACVSDGTLALYKKENLGQGVEFEREEAGKGTRKEQNAKLNLNEPSTKEQKVMQKRMS